MLTTYFRGRTSFMEMMNMPLDYINTLYLLAVERQKAEQAAKEKAEAEGKQQPMGQSEAIALEDELEEAFR